MKTQLKTKKPSQGKKKPAQAKKPTQTKNKHTKKKKPKPPSPKYRRENLQPFAKWILDRHARDKGVTEIRIIADKPTKGVWSGFFTDDHLEDLIDAIEPLPSSLRGKIPFGDYPRVREGNCYFTMQPVDPDLLARSAGEFAKCQATSDGDVIGYSLFGVDEIGRAHV